MKHYHRLLLVGILIVVLYLIKRHFDATRKKEGFLSTGEYIGIGIGVWIGLILLLLLISVVDKNTYDKIMNWAND